MIKCRGCGSSAVEYIKCNGIEYNIEDELSDNDDAVIDGNISNEYECKDCGDIFNASLEFEVSDVSYDEDDDE